MSDHDWYALIGGKLSDEQAEEMETRKKFFLRIPKEQWNGRELPLPEQPIAVLTIEGSIHFMETLDRRTGKTTDFRGVFNLISFAWNRQAIAWLSLGE